MFTRLDGLLVVSVGNCTRLKCNQAGGWTIFNILRRIEDSEPLWILASVCDFVWVVGDWKLSTPNTGVVVWVVLVEWIVKLAYGCGNTAPVSAAPNSSHPPVHWCPLG
ncbi:hypothetical protein T09_4123 [Trichinella sp. T9]|nr:hypothetical protein T09_4123 [Trichinella sp. T9]